MLTPAAYTRWIGISPAGKKKEASASAPAAALPEDSLSEPQQEDITAEEMPQREPQLVVDCTPSYVIPPEEEEGPINKITAVTNHALQSKERYPVNLEDVWKALGYSNKTHAVRAVNQLLREGFLP